MKIRPQQLPNHLTNLSPCYLVHGDEPLLLQELADSIRTAAKTQDFLERDLFHVETHFKWLQVLQADQEQSLFARHKIIEIRIPSGKFGKDGGAAIVDLLNSPNPDNIILIVSGKIDSKSQKTNWFKAIDACGVIVPVFPLDLAELPQWILQRAANIGLNINEEAAHLLATRTEGNLLASAQELEKLTLQNTSQKITTAQVENSVDGQTRYTSFQLVDEALSNKPQRALAILFRLQEKETEPLSILWVFVRELRQLNQIVHHPNGIQAGISQTRVWPKSRAGIVGKAARSHSKHKINAMLQRCLLIDKRAKGQGVEDVWVLLTQLIIELSSSTNT